MTQRFELRKGFLKLQRLGPVKFAEQSRWVARAPESIGMWAFPSPHFDIFFAYHKYTDLAPKELRGRQPKNAKWYTKDYRGDIPLEAIEFHEVDHYGEKLERAFYRDEQGELVEADVRAAWHEAKDNWVKNVGEKILPLREFWYSGELYTHFLADGAVGSAPMSSKDPGAEWSLMSTHKFASLLKKPGNVRGGDGQFDGDGKPSSMRYSSDHLEVFIPRGKGLIRDKV